MTIPREGTVINVILADGVTEMGLGRIIGATTIYFFKMPDGSLHFWQAGGPDEDLKDSAKPEVADKVWIDYLDSIGVRLIKMPDCAVIELDNERIVYGFQVFYVPVQKGDEP